MAVKPPLNIVLGGVQSYQLSIRGENFLVTMGDNTAKYGFFTTAFVCANDPNEAETIAIRRLREEPELVNITKNPRDDTPMLFCEEIYELETMPDEEKPGKVWFEENPVRWWQFWRWVS